MGEGSYNLLTRTLLESSEDLVRGGLLAERSHLRLERLLGVALLRLRVATVAATTLLLGRMTRLVRLLGNASALDAFV